MFIKIRKIAFSNYIAIALSIIFLLCCGSPQRIDNTRHEAEKVLTLPQQETFAKGTNGISEVTISEEKKPVEKIENRLVIYSAEFRLRVESVEKTLQKIQENTNRLGGFIESLVASDSYQYAKVITRIPATKFDEALDVTEKLGVVENKTVSASDVTMQYNDIALRISTSKKIRDRLYQILEKTTKASEKAEVLREIARLTAEIDNLTVQLNYLQSRINFSSISIELFALVRDTTKLYMASPFPWIASLTPYRRSIFSTRDRDLVYEPPKSFFSYEDVFFKKYSGAQDLFVNAEGNVKIKVGIVENYPKASQKFWEEAVRLEFENRKYNIKQTKQLVGSTNLNFNIMTIDLPARDVYSVAFGVVNDKIIVIEAYAKDEKAFNQNWEAIEKFIKSVGYD